MDPRAVEGADTSGADEAADGFRWTLVRLKVTMPQQFEIGQGAFQMDPRAVEGRRDRTAWPPGACFRWTLVRLKG